MSSRLQSASDATALSKPFLQHLSRSLASARGAGDRRHHGGRAGGRDGLALLASLSEYGLEAAGGGGAAGSGSDRYAVLSEDDMDNVAAMLIAAGGGARRVDGEEMWHAQDDDEASIFEAVMRDSEAHT